MKIYMQNVFLKRCVGIVTTLLLSHGAGAQAAEQTIFGSSVPAVGAEVTDQAAVQVGVKFRSSAAGQILGVRFYRSVESGSNYIVNVFNSAGTRVRTATLSRVSGAPAGWREVRFATPVNLPANTTYTASYYVADGQYAYTSNGMNTAKTSGNLTALDSASANGNGVYVYGSSTALPTANYENTNYFVDVIFTATSSDTKAPSIPTNLAASSVSSSQISLSFGASTDNVGVANYRIERCKGSTCTTFTQIAKITGTTFTNSRLAASVTYKYRVRAADAAGNLSGYSNIASAVTKAATAPSDTQAPSVPASLAASSVSSSQISLSFSAASDNVGVTGYRLERCSGSSCTAFAQIASIAGTSYSDSSLAASTAYSYRVRAADAAGNFSGYSNVASATTQSITAPPPASLDVEVPGPSAKMHLAHPHYDCVQNRYVSTSGNDSNDGLSLSTAWRSLDKANSMAAAGMCINIADGIYGANVSLNRGGNVASKTGFVVYRSINMLGAKVEASSGTYNGINVTGSYIILDGIEVNGKRLAGVDSGIVSCINKGGAYSGVHHIFVFNSYVHDVGGNGIAGCWSEYYWMIHNRSDNNAYASWNSGISTYEPMAIPGYTPTAYDNQYTPYHNVYLYNRFNGNFTSASGGPHTDGNGLIYDDTRHQQMSPNTTYPHSALIMGNLSSNNGGAGIQIGPTSANADIFNNTAYNNYLDPLNDGTWRGSISASFTVNVRFVNNIGVGVTGSGILSNNTAFMGGNPVSGTSWSNNVAQGNVGMEGATFSTTTNKVTNALLVNMAGGDFALCRGSGIPNASCTGASPALGFGAQVPYWQQQTPGQIDVGACPRSLDTCRSH